MAVYYVSGDPVVIPLCLCIRKDLDYACSGVLELEGRPRSEAIVGRRGDVGRLERPILQGVAQ